MPLRNYWSRGFTKTSVEQQRQMPFVYFRQQICSARLLVQPWFAMQRCCPDFAQTGSRLEFTNFCQENIERETLRHGNRARQCSHRIDKRSARIDFHSAIAWLGMSM